MFGGPGGHTCDLMAQDSNAQRNDGGIPLPHIAPVSSPQAMGVNLFTQDIAPVKDSVFESCYVFPRPPPPPVPANWSGFQNSFANRRHGALLSYLTGTPGLTGSLSSNQSPRANCTWPCKLMLTCCVVRVKMAL